MSESTLSLALEELRNAVARYMDYGNYSATLYSGLSTDRKAEIDHIVARGMRQFLIPPPLDGERNAHRWSFLVRPATLNLNEPSAPTQTVTVAAGVGTMSGGTLASWIASGVVQFNGSGQWYTVASRDGNTQFTLDDTSVAVSAGSTLEFRQCIVDLPDDFGGIEGAVTYQPASGRKSLVASNESWVRQQWQTHFATNGPPTHYAVRPRNWPYSSTTGQRWEMLVWPFPSTDYALDYCYLTDTNYPTGATYYPAGGMAHAETILASCLAVAEEFAVAKVRQYSGTGGLFMARLSASVSRDRANNVGIIGMNLANDDTVSRWMRRPIAGVTYNGTSY